MTENTAAAPVPENIPGAAGQQPDTHESKFPRGAIIRLFAYLIAGHVFAGFLYLLFEVGAK
ncbi:DUF6126 family protein [Streptomyces sp. CAU 1734]|uniref:DUF6126 family protein n=1 Tax=Streptomyces sp. CAU 1734 TaxID=3140360 RepID=UPI0032606209